MNSRDGPHFAPFPNVKNAVKISVHAGSRDCTEGADHSNNHFDGSDRNWSPSWSARRKPEVAARASILNCLPRDSAAQSRLEATLMTTYGFGDKHVIDTGGAPILRRIGLAMAAVLVLLLVFSAVTSVPSGHVGVLTLFGRVTGETLPEGMHLINPLKSSNEMSIRTNELKESASVPSAEGLVISLDTSLIFHLNPDKAADVYQKIGPNYPAVVIEPNLRAAIREATASHSANALYSGEREKVAREIHATLKAQLEQRGIAIESILLRDIQLPGALKQSIEAKQQAEQESLAMSFRLQKERQEADRKRIEAEGIRDFQHTVAQGISVELLTWKGIEATEKLADSKNSKVIVIGSGKSGLPIILGQ